MVCPHCSSSKTTPLKQRTTLGYERFRCRCCERHFNERTGTPFNYLEYTTDVVLLIVRWRLRYKLSLRDLAKMFFERGLEFTHEAMRDWEARFAGALLANEQPDGSGSRLLRFWLAPTSSRGYTRDDPRQLPFRLRAMG